jgi:transposase InsO family protein
VIVSDNAPGFSSDTLRGFLERNSVKHLFAAPYHPASNGQAERAVRVVKQALRKMKDGDFEIKL